MILLKNKKDDETNKIEEVTPHVTEEETTDDAKNRDVTAKKFFESDGVIDEKEDNDLSDDFNDDVDEVGNDFPLLPWF